MEVNGSHSSCLSAMLYTEKFALFFTYNNTVFSYVDIRSNLGSIDYTILLNNNMISDMKRKKCNPAIL